MKKNLTINLKTFLLLSLTFSIVMNLNQIFTSVNSLFLITFFLTLLNVSLIIVEVLKFNKNIVIPKTYLLLILLYFYYLIFGTFNQQIDVNIFAVVLSLLQNALIAFIMYYSISNMKRLILFLKTVEFSGFLLSLLAILEFLDIFYILKLVNNYTAITGNRIGVTWINPNTLGLVLCFSFICSLNMKSNPLRFLMRLIIIFGVLTTQSRSAFIAIIIFLFFIYYKKNKFKFSLKNFTRIILIIFIVVIIIDILLNSSTIYNTLLDSQISRLFTYSENTGTDVSNGRIPALLYTLNLVSENIIFGVGLGNVSFYTLNNQASHNMFINIWAESGVFPLVLFLFLLVSLFKVTIEINNKDFRYDLNLCLIFFLVYFSLFTHNLITNPLFGVAIGIILLDIDF